MLDKIITNNILIAKNGSTKNLIKILNENNFFKPLFLIDDGFYETNLWKEYEKKFKDKVKISKIIIDCKNEPTYSTLEYYLKEAKKYKFDVIVSLGGGSCMDTSKAIGAIVKLKKKAIQFRGFDKVKKPGVPVVCVPTTAGTGSEASYNASFVDEKTKIKMGINGKNIFPKISILDANNVISCPRNAAVSSAVDLYVHAIEGFVCKRSNIFCDLLAIEVLKIFFNSVLDLNNKKPNLKKRLNLMYAAYLAGIIQMNSGSGIASAISYPLSVLFKVPHGIGGGMFVLDIIKFNIQSGFKKYKILSDSLNLKKKSSNSFYIESKKIFEKLGVPKKLSTFNINKEDFKFICIEMLKMQNGLNQNPVKFSAKNDFPKLLRLFM